MRPLERERLRLDGRPAFLDRWDANVECLPFLKACSDLGVSVGTFLDTGAPA
jgi:hypothetical protein